MSEWNLICDDEWKVTAADSMFFAGFFCTFPSQPDLFILLFLRRTHFPPPTVGAGMLGQLADIRGRWAALYVSLSIAGVGAAISAISFGFWQYFVSKFIIGFGCGGIGVASFVLSTEPLGAKWRALLGIATQYWWAAVRKTDLPTQQKGRRFTCFKKMKHTFAVGEGSSKCTYIHVRARLLSSE